MVYDILSYIGLAGGVAFIVMMLLDLYRAARKQ